MNTKVSITGTKKGGYIIWIEESNDHFRDSIAVTREELLLLLEEIKKKI